MPGRFSIRPYPAPLLASFHFHAHAKRPDSNVRLHSALSISNSCQNTHSHPTFIKTNTHTVQTRCRVMSSQR